jgi:predicted phosphoserine aminotransferase
MHKRLFIPGPTEVRREVLDAQGQWMIGHRGRDFSELYGGILEKLKKVLSTEKHLMVFTASGTGLMEAAIRNGVGKKVLCCVNGAFSERWARIAESCGKEVDRLEVEWGRAITPRLLKEKLEEGYEAVAIVQNETSTGVKAKLDELYQMVKESGALLFVDTVSSLGGDRIEIDRWGIDMCLTSSQKCFATPPGLAICAVSDEMLERSKRAEDKGYYFDLALMAKYTEERGETPSTPAISLMYALNAELDYMLDEGMENRFRRHEQMAQHVRGWASERFSLFAEPGYESVTVTCVNSKGIDVGELIKVLGEKGIAISDGYGKLKGKTFRIAHMGDLTLDDLKGVTEEIDRILGR